MIFILNKHEKVINILKNGHNGTPFYNDLLTEDLTTGAETFAFSTIAKDNVSKDLVVGNYVAFKKDNKFKLFQIVQVSSVHEEDMEISVFCECAGLSLMNRVYRARKMQSATFRKFLESVVEDSDWNVGSVDIGLANTIDLDLEDSTAYTTLQENLSKFGVEIEFRVEINSGRVSKKFIDAYVERGKNTGKIFTFGKDIEGITKTVDSTNLCTALVGRGKGGISFKDVTVEGIDKPLGQDFVFDQKAYELYNRNGYHLTGIFKFDTESPEELLRMTYKELQKVKEPKVTYDVNVALLGHLLDRDWEKVRIGDYIGIADTSFNPPLTLMARVSKLETSFTNPQEDKCTLTNFIEVTSNISEEMRKIASQLEGYVEGAIENRFPIDGEDIKEGAINGVHIYESSITTDHLYAGSVTAEKIKADSIETKHLQADSIKSQHISSEQIEANHIKSGTITAEKIQAGTITAESGIIADATIGTAQIKDAEITVAKIQNAFVDSLVANQGKFQSAHIGKLTSDNIDANTIKAEHITASVIDAINLNVEGKISADRIEAIEMVIEEIDAGKITTGTLDADRITSSVITAINASIENATIDSAKIGSLSADKITSGDIETDRLKANAISAINASIGNATINSAKIGELDASKITTGTLDADRIEAGSIDASKISSDTISAIEVSASEITASKIASGEIKVGDANIIDGTISGAKITKASIGNAQISEAFIADAFIQNITADKIKGGTLDAKDITVKNLNAESITVGQINGKQIAQGAIGYDKLDEFLSGDIRNTITNVDKVLEDVGLVQETVEKTVKSVDVEYAQNDSSTNPPTSGWQTTPPTWTNGKFIWSRTTTVLSDGTSSTTDPVCITGAKGSSGSNGSDGKDGKGVKSTSITYQASSSGTVTPTGSWSQTIPSVGAGQYLWTRTITTYTDDSTTTSYSIGRMGTNGTNGSNGSDGKGIKTTTITYQASNSGTSVPSGSWVSSIPTVSAGQFLWTKTVITYTDNTTSTSYSVGKMGEKGDKGDTGAIGQGVDSITEEYCVSTSKTTAPESGWTTTPPTWSSGKYVWTRSKIVYKNPTATKYTTPICDSSWEAVNEVEVGGRNLIVKSSNLTVGYLKSDGSAITTDTAWYYTDYISVVEGKQYIASGYKNLGNAPSTCFYNSSKTFVSGIDNGNSVSQATESTIKNDKRRIVTIPAGCTYMRFSFEKVDLDKIKLEKGNKPTDYTPAPEDVNNEISKVTTIANGKNSVYYSTSAPSTTGKKENDIWFDTDDGYRMYSFTGGKWVATQFGTNAIVNEAITTSKIASESITTGKIVSGAITTDKLYALSVTTDKVDANAITSGKIAADSILANHIKSGQVTTDKLSANSVTAEKIDVDNLFVGDNAFIKKLKAIEIDASNITTGTISNERIDITGLVSFEAFDQDLKPVFNVQGDKTYINGGMIATNTIKANSIDLLSGLTVQGQDGQNTFAIASNGEVEVNGLLKSGNFDEDKNTGYQLSTDGKAILNQAVVKGDVILPNAGITNKYDMSQSEGRNLVKLSQTFGDMTGLTTDGWKRDNSGVYTILNISTTSTSWFECQLPIYQTYNSLTKKVTVSFEYKNSTSNLLCFNFGAYKDSGRVSEITNWAVDTHFATTALPNGWKRATLTFDPTSVNNKTANCYKIQFKKNSGLTGNAWIRKVKLEIGETVSDWTPAPEDNSNPVRIWAGSNYELRDSAPFRVMQNGDIYATNGTFNGKMYGDLDSGLVHIHNNEIVINSTKTFMDEDGVVRSIEAMDYNPNPHLRLGAGTSIINTDLILGSESDKKMVFSNGNRELNLNNMNMKVSGAMTDLFMDKSSGAFGGLNLISKVNNGHHVLRHSSASDKVGTMVFDSEGGQGQRGDFSFTRKNYGEDVKVDIDGGLFVKNGISSSKQNIEMRSVANEGWGFYAT